MALVHGMSSSGILDVTQLPRGVIRTHDHRDKEKSLITWGVFDYVEMYSGCHMSSDIHQIKELCILNEVEK